MCQFISFHHKPTTGDIAVAVLASHSDTEQRLKLNLALWREGHYTPNGEAELRFTDDDRVNKAEYKQSFLNRFPTFVSFFNWCMEQTNQKEKYDGQLYLSGLYLSGLTSAKDLVLPKTVGGGLYLSGLTSAKDLVLPKTGGGGLYLSGLTSAKGLVLPKTVGGGLYLSDKVRAELKAMGKL